LRVEITVISPESIDRLTFGLSSGGIGAEDRDEFAVKAFLLHAGTSAFLKVSIGLDELCPIL